MARPNLEQVRSWCGRTIVDSDGASIGTVIDIYLHSETEDPVWALVDVRQFGAGARMVPLASASEVGGDIVVPHPRAVVVAAPDVAPDEEISAENERGLYRYYGLHYADSAEQEGSASDERSRQPESRVAAAPDGRARSDDVASPDQGARPSGEANAPGVVRSEEELLIKKERRPGRTVRMKKEVVTDYVTTTVPVRRERLRLVEEPVTEERAQDTATTEEPEVTLHEEEPVIEKRVVPRERVRLRKENVTSQAEVSDEVRKEHVEVSKDDVGNHEHDRDR